MSLPQEKIAVAPAPVVLVGCGPGAADLLTLRALRAIESADVLVYDNLIGDEILDFARPDAEKIYVGKRAAQHTLPQEEINALLVRLARAGKRTARLKGGDPFIFGRGGEEMDELRAAGIAVEVIPGVTAAAACAAAAGIPLTHREHARTLVLTTGHSKPGAQDPDWEALARPGQTVAFYMGVRNAGEIERELLAHGMPGETKIAIIERGATARQRIHAATLATLTARIAAAAVKAPALLIVGEVAAYVGDGTDANSDSPAGSAKHTANE
ncbi:uroporphyrinogen-III C-methyltransferase [Rhodocyclus purpureus]|uniref:uroporphyrinogen-III C-methyltransferase n=1 Tax=Rhodocyclus purpureus TaxID=1067 RepID=UPI001911DB2A|nr:uroporphyrinogen-III C-methyltransferase [Rhodocyclus purpureus]MBK5914738.1 uroporphyrinogen-III C-methyltransferase [Rhodocyclus purpureus]